MCLDKLILRAAALEMMCRAFCPSPKETGSRRRRSPSGDGRARYVPIACRPILPGTPGTSTLCPFFSGGHRGLSMIHTAKEYGGEDRGSCGTPPVMLYLKSGRALAQVLRSVAPRVVTTSTPLSTTDALRRGRDRRETEGHQIESHISSRSGYPLARWSQRVVRGINDVVSGASQTTSRLGPGRERLSHPNRNNLNPKESAAAFEKAGTHVGGVELAGTCCLLQHQMKSHGRPRGQRLPEEGDERRGPDLHRPTGIWAPCRPRFAAPS